MSHNVRETEVPTPGKPVEIKSIPTLPTDTLALLQEFETVFGEVEMSHGALTPPESPTTSVVPTFPVEIVEKQHQNGNSNNGREEEMLIFTQLQPALPLTPVAANAEDLAREMAVVDELVRTRVEDLVPNTSMELCVVDPWRNSASSSSSSPSPESSDVESDASHLSAPIINHVTPPSPSSSSLSGYEDSDPEWTPGNWKSPPSSPQENSPKARRSKPYGRSNQNDGTSNHSRRRSTVNVEEKRLRKKEQNKNAATRYRMKKKAEVEEILGEEKGLQDENSELQQKVSDLSREIKYLKGLMRDMLKAKGTIK